MPGVALTDRGREAAVALGDRLAGLDLVLRASSPMERCRETAALAGLEQVEVVAGFTECGYGAWTGRALRDLAEDPLWRVVQDSPGEAYFPASPEYAAESLTQMGERIWATLTGLDADLSNEHGEGVLWAAVTHGDPIKAALAHASGAGIGALQRFRVDPASISVITWASGRPTIAAVNTHSGGLAAFRPRRHTEEVGGGSGD